MRDTRIATAITAALWVLAALSFWAACTIAPAAINATFGIGFWASIATAVSIAMHYDDRNPR